MCACFGHYCLPNSAIGWNTPQNQWVWTVRLLSLLAQRLKTGGDIISYLSKSTDGDY